MPEKLKMEFDPMSTIVEKIKEICPSAVTESGKIDFDALKQDLSDEIADDTHEKRYDFVWVGKDDAKREYKHKTNKTFRPDIAESKDWDTTKNLYIEGDNLDALKLLQKSYAGAIKMIYIDPPYNTGNDFVYCDDFMDSCKDYLTKKEVCDEEGNRLFKNTKDGGQFHSNWCNMMYPRLKIARDLLSKDGVIFISIDDNEVTNLRKICDEVFGESNFISEFIWESIFRPSNMSTRLRKNAEYVLAYARQNDQITTLVERFQDPQGEASLTQNNNSPRKLLFPANTVLCSLNDGTYDAGNYGDVILHDQLIVEHGKIINDFGITGKFKWSQEYLDNEIKNGVELKIKTQSFIPYYKKIYQQTELKPTKLVPTDLVGDVLSANAELTNLFNNKLFDYPKPVSLIKFLIFMLQTRDDAIILDFFSGSATTAQAVMKLNAEDGGHRKFIMVQLPENLDKNLEEAAAGSKDTIQNAINLCDELGRPHKLTEIAKERIRRAGDKIVSETGKSDLDTGFRVLKIDSSNMNDKVFAKPGELTQADLLTQVDNIKSDRNDMDLLFGVMTACRLPLDMPIETVKSGKQTYYVVNDGDLVACFDQHISEDLIVEIAKRKPDAAIFRDSSFAEAKDKINVSEIFKNFCGDDKCLKIL